MSSFEAILTFHHTIDESVSVCLCDALALAYVIQMPEMPAIKQHGKSQTKRNRNQTNRATKWIGADKSHLFVSHFGVGAASLIRHKEKMPIFSYIWNQS